MATEAPPSKFSRYRSVRDAAKTGPSSSSVRKLPQSAELEASNRVIPLHRIDHALDVEASPSSEPQCVQAQQSSVDTSTDYQGSTKSKRQDIVVAEERCPINNLRQDHTKKASPVRQKHLRSQDLPAYEHLRREDSLTTGVEMPNDHTSTDRFGLFSRRKTTRSAETPTIPSHKENRFKIVTKDMISAPIGIQPGGRGVVPGIDAPVSAVNAGERRVIVKCNKSSILLPVTPSTTPVDIIRSAANVLSEEIDIETAVLLESFKQLGLERPLRRYEHLRDVLNSWDQDDQNAVLIVPSTTRGNDEDLNIKKVPAKAPRDISAHMYYSQKPGSWDKRWVTLREDGQVLMAKENGGAAKNICHIRDFDIYVPTLRQISKKLKPPKKLCLAIKSQHKTSMFLSTANFVHFFSTKDKEVASAWYKGVQEWRSWYLVNIMGNGKPSPQHPAESTQHSSPLRQRQESKNRPHQPNHNSLDSWPYLKNSFEPLLPTNVGHLPTLPPKRFPPQPSKANNGEAIDAQKKTSQSRAEPSATFPKKLVKDAEFGPFTRRADGDVSREAEDEAFVATGLPDRTYSRRQKAQRPREQAQAENHTSAPGTQVSERGAPPGGTLSLRPGSDEGKGVARAGTQRQKPKPLIDLTPQYQELPQHIKKGRGVVPRQMPAGGLVDIATSPEVAIAIPRATTWRRPGTSHGRENS